MSGISITPLTTTVGARIDGVDLRKKLPDTTAEIIRQALWDHSVIVFHDQHIDVEQQKAVAGIFGKVEAVKPHRMAGDDDPVTMITPYVWERAAGEVEPLPSIAMLGQEFPAWHVDSCFCEEIPRIACLRPELLSPVGGATSWAKMAAAYDALSSTMQAWLETLDVVFAPPPGYTRFLGLENFPKEKREAWENEFRPRLHPLVARHPDSGRKQFFVNPSYSVKIDKLSNSESAMLLRFLFKHCFQSDFVYRHSWNYGDIVIWDELATAHLAPTDFAPHPRRLARVFAGTTKVTAARDSKGPMRRLRQTG